VRHGRAEVVVALAAVQALACVGQRAASDEAVRHEVEPLEPARPSVSTPLLAKAPPTDANPTPAAAPSRGRPSSTVSRSMPPTILSERLLLRSSPTGSGYELELQRPVGFAPSGLPLRVQLGSFQLRAARESPTVGEYGAVFPISQEQFDALPDGTEVILLSSVSGTGRSLGRLDKAALRIR
jgi:hypothetical protein